MHHVRAVFKLYDLIPLPKNIDTDTAVFIHLLLLHILHLLVSELDLSDPSQLLKLGVHKSVDRGPTPVSHPLESTAEPTQNRDMPVELWAVAPPAEAEERHQGEAEGDQDGHNNYWETEHKP